MAEPSTDPRRHLPAVDRLLHSDAFTSLLAAAPAADVVRHVRRVLEQARRGDAAFPLPTDAAGWRQRVEADMAAERRRGLLPVLNATGVVLHTNLGRAVLSSAAAEAVAAVAGSYCTLEFDLERGERGHRGLGAEALLTDLTGAQSALVVNNAAAALVLALASVARGGRVVVSRGELIEIGGRFRIPDVVEAAGLRLHEVGTTNRTRLADYARAVERPGVGAVLKVHRSNFRMSGFTEEVAPEDLAAMAAARGVPVVHDLGTGLLVDLSSHGLPDEPTVQASVRSGAALTVFSGDKLLGGPQAGVLAGWDEAVTLARRHPLARAVRADRLTLAALQATLAEYRDPGRAWETIPALRMIALPEARLEARARALARALADLPVPIGVEPGASVVGGGTLPGATLPTRVLRVPGGDALSARLRLGEPPVVARVEEGAVLLDLRTILPEQDGPLVGALRTALTSFPAPD